MSDISEAAKLLKELKDQNDLPSTKSNDTDTAQQTQEIQRPRNQHEYEMMNKQGRVIHLGKGAKDKHISDVNQQPKDS